VRIVSPTKAYSSAACALVGKLEQTFFTEIAVGLGSVGADMGDCLGGDVGGGGGASAGSGPGDDIAEKTFAVVIVVAPVRNTMLYMWEK
jgi:hypothetical protein